MHLFLYHLNQKCFILKLYGCKIYIPYKKYLLVINGYFNKINISAKSIVIENKIRLVLKNKVKKRISNSDYLKKGATKKVVRILEKLNLKKMQIKNFFDLDHKNF